MKKTQQKYQIDVSKLPSNVLSDLTSIFHELQCNGYVSAKEIHQLQSCAAGAAAQDLTSLVKEMSRKATLDQNAFV